MKDKKMTGLGLGAPIVTDVDVDFTNRITGGALILQLKYAKNQYQYMQGNFDRAAYVIPASLIDDFFESVVAARGFAKNPRISR